MGRKRKPGRKDPGGRPLVHGAYSTLKKNVVKGQPRLRHYLTSCREGLIADVARTEEELTTGQLIIIDRLVSKVAVLRLMEAHVAQVGAIKDGVLLPLLAGPFLRFADSIRADLALLGIERRSVEKALTFADVAHKYDKPAQDGTILEVTPVPAEVVSGCAEMDDHGLAGEE